MIFEFKSRATGTVIATQDVAERILRIIGKSPAAKGVILPEQMAKAIADLQHAIDTEKQAARQAPDSGRNEIDNAGDDTATPVSLAQRAYPFVEMLRQAMAAGKEITWGV